MTNWIEGEQTDNTRANTLHDWKKGETKLGQLKQQTSQATNKALKGEIKEKKARRKQTNKQNKNKKFQVKI